MSDRPCRLLVEGIDEKHSIYHLLLRCGYDLKVCVNKDFFEVAEGVEKLLAKEFISNAAKSYSPLGIVVDSNTSMASRWDSLRNTLGELEIILPSVPDPAGTIVDGIRPGYKVGIWLMPDNRREGTLENFLASLRPDADVIWDYSIEATGRARELGAVFPASLEMKAAIHAWLAWQEEPGHPYGTAIKSQYFCHDRPLAISFVNWFTRLFLESKAE